MDSPPVFAQNYGIDNIVYQFEANGVRRMTHQFRVSGC